MKTHFKKITGKVQDQTTQLSAWYNRQHLKYKISIGVLGFLILSLLIKLSFGGTEALVKNDTTPRKVIVASVAELSSTDRNFPLVGKVTSVNEAVIRSESSGRLTYVSKKLGDVVYAGGVIAEFENSGEKAALLQAEGAYEQAKASRNIASLNSGQAGSSLVDTKNQSVNTVINAYTTMDDAIRGKTDGAFVDPKFSQVKLLISVPDANLSTSLESERRAIEKMLIYRETKNKTLSSASDLLAELDSVHGDAQIIKTYLDNLYTAYSKALPDTNFSQSQLDGGRSNTQIARQSISATISGLVGARTTLSASITANKVAGSDSQAESSGSLATADAQVKQALGAYNAALSRLQKTIIRSPITGTLNSLSISTGDYIGSFSQVAIVSNNGALEVVSFVTEDDAKRIAVSSPVTINEIVAGVVTRIASAIDPTTKKIEVRIGIKDAKSGLVNGQSVSIAILKNKQNIVTNPNAVIVIPLSALKLSPYGANVFVISSTSSLVAIPVKEGAILGEQIQILEGLQGDELIVTDARGLKEGVLVEVETK